ncbi:MAG: T3SS effector HopA1 family protein [Nostoc sp. DedSLP03]|uniref:T3SS effector HopA1 family protein n=1 Tax=Nostoc sp. DedSLP03 TaxID=3075400 RepID=UPI002AD29FDD|nr:T3SS effector HopA1 family protein [Nostoc sp. DedSLP03]MDZ7965770.1 T3SS effector HopA1 family protein [Nostoc sp. DedSLP03]
MPFILSNKNIFNYLIEHGFSTQLESALYQVESIRAKNFNLLLTLPNSRKLLIKQERHNQEGKTAGEFLSEWRIQEFLQTFPELSYLRSSMPEVLHFEAEHSIIVFSYLDDYRDLADFYGKEKIFPTQIVEALATVLATIHRVTFNRQDYQEFFSAKPNNLSPAHVPNWIGSIERIEPEIFGVVPADGLKFFKLYQRYESLRQAMKELADVFQPCCLTHNDLKLNNILLHNNWGQESDGSFAVTKGGLTLHIKPEKHLQLAENPAIDDLVAIRMPKNFVQSGFYMAVGNAGPRSYSHPNREPEIVRIYFNFSPEGAVAVMGSLTRELNDISIPFTFKVLYNPGEYRRYDSGVLYFEKSNYEAVRQVLESVYAQTKAYFNPDVPLFTKFLAPGLGLAEEPDSKFAEQESFGMNRCQIIANGLLEAWHSLDDSPEGRMTSILKQFSLLKVELLRSYLNPTSFDIYTPLNL